MAPKNKKTGAAKAAAKAEQPKVEEPKVEEKKAEEPVPAAEPKGTAEPKAKAESKAKAKAKAKAETKAEEKAEEMAEEMAEEKAEEKAEPEPPKFDDKGKRLDVVREDVEKFFSGGIDAMTSKNAKKKLADKSKGRPGALLIELQQKVWDNMGVNRDKGRQAVDEFETRFEDHDDLVKARDLFIRTAQLTYLQALEDRKPKELQTKEELTRDAVLEFCDACCAKTDLQETMDAMAALLKKGEMPDQVILDVQMDMFETLGYEREHGKDSLEKLETLYPKDEELIRSTSIWQQKGQTTCLQVLNKHMLEGGELPENPQKDALEFQVLQHRAKEQLSKMIAKTRGELFEKMRAKVQVFRGLPPDARQSYMMKLPLEDRIELIKGEVLFNTVIQQQQQQKQRQELQKQYQARMQQMAEQQKAAEEKQAAFEERKRRAHAKAAMKKHAC